MTPDRERQILAYLYGTDTWTVTALNAKRVPEGDGPDAGAWVGPGITYYPSPTELIITRVEAGALAARKLVAWGIGISLAPTANGRDYWRRIGSPTP